MPIVYFDSSAFVKLLVDEDGSALAAALWNGADVAVSSRLAYPEVRSALAAARRARRLKPVTFRRAEAVWETFWAATRAVELSDRVTAHAGQLAGRHALRGADAVHLPSALAIGLDQLVFAGWDQPLRAGAAAASLTVAPMV
jgi:predicted nucleic acid-binding protein